MCIIYFLYELFVTDTIVLNEFYVLNRDLCNIAVALNM